MHPYIPHTEADIASMLEKIGAETVDALFSDIPEEALLKSPLNLPKTHSEQAILRKLTGISKENIDPSEWLRFVGGGLYDHHIPTIVPQLLLRSEFNTAYTPYQPEISQGTLQAIFEYQTMITELTGMDVANASHYDGTTALAEAAFMACGASRRDTVLVSEALPVESRNVLQTYLTYKDLKMVIVPAINGRTPLSALEPLISKEVAAYIVATPNANGLLEDLKGVSDALHKVKSLLIIASNPMTLGLYKSPGEWGADIAVGDGQVFGNPVNFGGPTLGFIACTTKLMRKMPGRIVGETVDLDGERGYVLTLQAREQHIRREKATSNITSNQALNALAATIYLSTLGLKGIQEVARRSRINAHYLKDELCAIDGVNPAYEGPYYNEFLLEIDELPRLIAELEGFKIIPGIQIDERHLLVATTEVHDKADLDAYIQSVKEVLA